MLRHERLACFLFVCLSFTASASVQQPNSHTHVGDSKIYLDVVVTSKSGPPASGLQKEDFTLLDNNVPQTITSFEAVNGRAAPIEIVLVIDAVNATVQAVCYERIQIDRFLGADGGHLAYPIAVLTDKGIQIAANYSSDGNALSAALQQDNAGLRVIGRSSGFYGDVDRFQISIQALSQLVGSMAQGPGRKLILWASPGWPLFSGPGVNLAMDSKQQQQVFANIVSFSTQFEQAHVTLYSVNPLGTAESVTAPSYYKGFLKGITKPSQANYGNLGLPVLAVQSGGLAFFSNNDVAALLRECLSEKVPYFEISFDPASVEKPNEYHQLEIRPQNPGLTIRTRQGYYAQP